MDSAGPLWLRRLEEYQAKNGLTDYAIERAVGKVGTGLITKAKSRARAGQVDSISLRTLYALARVMHCSPRGLIETTVPKLYKETTVDG